MAHLEAALLVKSVMEKEARERMIDAHTAKEILPELNGQTRDKLGEMLNMLM